MKIDAHHRFAAPLGDVATAMLDPDFHAALCLPDVEAPEVLDASDDGVSGTVRVRYRFTGVLDPIAGRVLGAQHIAWVQEIRLDRSLQRGTLRVLPEIRGVRVTCAARIALRDDGGATDRALQGELRVHVPLIGARAESAIGPGVLRRIDLEADALSARLQA